MQNSLWLHNDSLWYIETITMGASNNSLWKNQQLTMDNIETQEWLHPTVTVEASKTMDVSKIRYYTLTYYSQLCFISLRLQENVYSIMLSL